ncbi:MATE family efflux transporter [Aureispira anguillae]|uniref:MATE family efflux transporter n=1 Tax=Aureispira anguillae TaxID=2864201 RepID=A0A915YIC2_9BACT|nr:MATE family efflux transporter [Aureispira anguillae]BDS13590.1 MATE family efflux transporter [Aureispira anguillae]
MKFNKEILQLAIPNIISNISVPLISSVDTGLMGGLSALHIGAVGLGSMIFNFIYWNFGFLRMGTTGLTAQAFGQENDAAIVHTWGRALIIALILSGLILFFQKPLASLGFSLMNVTSNQYDLVASYFFIRIWAAPASLLLVVMMGWFFGMQNAIYPLLLTIIINISNILVSYWLVNYYEWGVAGVAYGTVIAQYIGATVALGLFAFKYKYLLAHFQKKVLLASHEFLGFLRINSDIFLRTFCLTIAFGFFYSQSAAAGAEILAVNTILMQFLNWMSFGVDGFAYAAESLVGKYKGANQMATTKKMIRLSMYWGMGLACCFSFVYGVYGNDLVHLFTDQATIVELATPYIWWMVVLPLVGTPCYIWDGIFVGLTAVKAMRNSMLLALLTYLLCYGILTQCYPDPTLLPDILWFCLLSFLAVRGLVQWALFRQTGLAIQ